MRHLNRSALAFSIFLMQSCSLGDVEEKTAYWNAQLGELQDRHATIEEVERVFEHHKLEYSYLDKTDQLLAMEKKVSTWGFGSTDVWINVYFNNNAIARFSVESIHTTL